MKNDAGKMNIIFGWCWLFLGILVAMWLGMYAFKSEWLGGYSSLSRRFLRLGHIAFMALSLANILYGLCLNSVYLSMRSKVIGSVAMIIAAISMPLVCFVCVVNSHFEIFFPIPVLSFSLAVCIMIAGQVKRIKYENKEVR